MNKLEENLNTLTTIAKDNILDLFTLTDEIICDEMINRFSEGEDIAVVDVGIGTLSVMNRDDSMKPGKEKEKTNDNNKILPGFTEQEDSLFDDMTNSNTIIKNYNDFLNWLNQKFDKLKMIKIFNLNQSKKNVVRVLKLSKLLDCIYDQMIARVESRPGEFSNEDLMKYVTTIQSAIEKANKSLDLVQEAPAIGIGTQINIVNQGEVFDRESREKILRAVESISKRAKEAGIEIEDYTISDDDTKQEN